MKAKLFTVFIFEDNLADLEAISLLVHDFCQYRSIPVQIVAKDRIETRLSGLKQADFLVLDMEIQGESGLEFGRRLRKIYPDLPLIITSGYSRYLVDGYSLHAQRYFLKPVDPEVFYFEMDTVFKELSVFQNRILDHPKLAFYQLQASRIDWVEYMDRKCIFHLHNQESVAVSMPFYECIALLTPFGFCQTYKSCLVNLSTVSQSGLDHVVLKSGDIIPLSRRFRKQFEKELRQWKLKTA